MERDRNKMVESLLNLTLEIIYQLTGEDYTVVKKTSSGRCQAPVYTGLFLGSPPLPLIEEEINGQKILELTNKMLELLTGEVTLLGMLGHYTVTGGVGVMTVSLCCQVPIRCQDVAVYFSMEEWEYLEGHEDLYKEVMMEDHQPLTSAGNRHDYIHMDFHYLYLQVKDLSNIMAITIKKDPYVSGDEECEEDIPPGNHPDFSLKYAVNGPCHMILKHNVQAAWYRVGVSEQTDI
ncbi:uncharacterized protein LOC142188808 [Leptodactylus fuscus]|uniref:uncharacterized protein LOC142188808 n=1 Tax=Leptodactylus fuscus TaxID=238119 RepID=UPI003F4EB800